MIEMVCCFKIKKTPTFFVFILSKTPHNLTIWLILKSMETVLQKNDEAKVLINKINVKINLLKKRGVDAQLIEKSNTDLIKANDQLRLQIAIAMDNLVQMEVSNGKKQVPLPKIKPMELNGNQDTLNVTIIKSVNEQETTEIHDCKVEQQILNNVKPKMELKKETKNKGDKISDNADSDVIDVSKLNMRVGKILEVSRHPDADSLFIEKVDVGEDKPRQIISGLVKYCSEEELLGRLGVFLLNLKPAKMRGVMSEGMIMCASAPEQGKVEPLLVPEGAKAGDRVTVEGYDGVPDDVLNPKKKVFELIKPDLRVNSEGVATYKGSRWQVNGQVGSIVSKSLVDVQIS